MGNNFSLCNQPPGQLSLLSLRGKQIEYWSVWLKLRWCTLTHVKWQCNLIWQLRGGFLQSYMCTILSVWSRSSHNHSLVADKLQKPEWNRVGLEHGLASHSPLRMRYFDELLPEHCRQFCLSTSWHHTPPMPTVTQPSSYHNIPYYISELIMVRLVPLCSTRVPPWHDIQPAQKYTVTKWNEK